jgi:hypothetical protein
MLIIGCDFHSCYQQIDMLDEATGAFYRSLQGLRGWLAKCALRAATAVGLATRWKKKIRFVEGSPNVRPRHVACRSSRHYQYMAASRSR